MHSPREIYSIVHCVILLEGVSMPSIAQLEERGTVKENTVRSRGHWFDPGSKDFLLVARFFGAMTMTHHLAADSAMSFNSSLTLHLTPDYFVDG